MAEINQFLSAEAQKEVQNYIASLETIVLKYKDIATALIQLEKTKQEELKTEKMLLDNQKKAEELAQKKLKTQKDEVAASERLEKAAKLEADAIKKKNSAYEQLKKNHSDAVRQTRELAAANKQGTAEFIKASNEAKKYGDQLKRVNDTTGAPATNNVGKYFQAIMKGAGVLGLAVGAAQLLTAGFNKLKTSSQAFGDAFAEKKEGVNFQINKFFSMIGTGDFSNFIENMKKAGQAGRDYAKAIDDQFEGGLSLTIKEAESRLKIAELKTKIAQTKNADDIKKYGNEILAEETRITEGRLTEASKVYEAEKNNILRLQGIKEEDFIKFLKNYRVESGIRESVIFKQEEINKISKRLETERNQDIAAQLIWEQTQIKSSFTNEELMFIEFNKKYQGLANENIEKTAESYANLSNIKAQKLEESLRTEMKITNAENKLIKESTRENEKELETIGKIRIHSEETILDLKIESDKKQGDLLKERYDKNKRILDQETEDAIEAERRKQEARQQAIDMTIQMVDTLFSYQQARLSAEMDSIERYYETRINAASNAGEDTAALEREYEIKRAEMDIKIAKSKRNQALLDIAISTAVNTTKAGLEPWLIPFLITLGALQAAVVMAQPLPEIPAFSTGTMDSPSTFIAGEKGREIGITKGGRAFVTPDKATLYSGMPGTKIIPNDLAELVLKDIGTNVLDRKLDKVIAAIEKQQTNVYIDKSLSRSINLKHIRSKHGRN